jgi:uncharacterized DUF497 family protein
MTLRFEWDRRKADVNVEKHRVSFEEGTTVFADPLSRTVRDDRHMDELRFATMGMSEAARLLVVVHTDRGSVIRVISARPANPREKRAYEKDDT